MDELIKAAATAYVEREGEKIIEEARKLNKENPISEEQLAEFEQFCEEEFRKLDKSKTMYELIMNYSKEEFIEFLINITSDREYISKIVCAECQKTKKCGSDESDITDCPYASTEDIIRAFVEIKI